VQQVKAQEHGKTVTFFCSKKVANFTMPVFEVLGVRCYKESVLKNWKSNLFFAVAFGISLLTVYVQIFGGDSIKEKTVFVADWISVQDRLEVLEKQLLNASSILEQKTIIDSDQLMISKLEKRTDNLEALFLSKAQIAVTIPLLKKEMEALKKESEYQQSAISNTNNMVIALIAIIFAQLAAVFFFVRENKT
jgi:hypothetical protein